MKKFIIFLVSFVALVLIASYTLPRQPDIQEDFTNIDSLVEQWMESTAIPGLAIAKINPTGNIIKTYGLANIEKQVDVNEDTLFNIASISKPMLGIVLLQLVDQGKLELDRDINDYLPFEINNPKLDGEVITVRHLASHSSGIDDNYHFDRSTTNINKDSNTSLEEHLKSYLVPGGRLYNDGQFYLDYMPGTQRKYSNLSAGLAGYLVEVVTGIPLAQYSQKSLFEPLGMTNTSWLLNDLTLSDKATPYEVETCIPFTPLCTDTESPVINHMVGKYINPPMQYKHYTAYPHYGDPQYPDGGVNTSIKQLSQFMQLVLKNEDLNGNQILSQQSYAEMFELQLPTEISENQRFFWRDNDLGLTGHMGSSLGVFTVFYFDRIEKTGIIVLMNRGLDAKSGQAAMAIGEYLMQK